MNVPKLLSGIRRICRGVKPRKWINYSVISMALAVFGIVPAHAQPSWYDSTTQSGIEPGSPDFYQHQLNESGAFTNQGYCAYYAYEDAMYYDANNGFSKLYANDANWVNGMTTNFLNIYAQRGPGGFFDNYINSKGYSSLLGVTSTPNPGSGYSVYSTLSADLLAGSNALIYITNNVGTTNQWWGFHVMDVVGFSMTNHTIYVLDPDNNMYGGYGFPGTATNPPASGFYTNGFKVPVPFSLVYYNTNEPFPVETGWASVGGPTNSLVQGYTLDASGDITSGIYAGTDVGAIFAIGPVPEPSTIGLGLASAITFGAYRLARRKKDSRSTV